MNRLLSYRRMMGVLLWIGGAQVMNAQNIEQRPWQPYLEQLSEMEDYESVAWEDYEAVLEEYAEHPLNINTATREELEQFPFLSAGQVEDIQAYVYQYGEMKSLGELAMIESINWYQRQLLSCFVYAGEVPKPSFPSLCHIMKYGKHEAVADVKIPFYQRKGDVEGYMGYPLKHWLRYQFRRSDYVKWGFLASQDAGEPFFAGKNKWGYDFYSFYLQVKKWGRWKNITLGRYRLSEGMGLILNNDFGFGKLSALSSLGRMGTSIRVHSSRSSANYLQGAAATLNVAKGLDVSAFVSYRTIDATVKNDSISTIQTSGLHRTELEIEKQGAAKAFLAGGNLHYSFKEFHVGATGIFYSYSLPLYPDKSQLYKRFAPEGKSFWNMSVDYGYVSHRLTMQGETAMGDCGVVATVNSMSYLFSEKWSLLALYRFYPYRYYAMYSNSFKAGSDVQDESGGYVGMRWTPSAKWMVEAYGDVAYFAWPKYHTTGSTYAMDYLVSAVCQLSSFISLGARYQYKWKNEATTQRARLYLRMNRSAWSSKTQVDATWLSGSRGYMASEAFAYRYRWLRLQASMGYFHTSDYDSRVYALEPGMLYTMSFGSYFGEGIRCALLAKVDVGSHWLLACKWAMTQYFDRNHISSGLQQINGSCQSDLELQLKWKW